MTKNELRAYAKQHNVSLTEARRMAIAEATRNNPKAPKPSIDDVQSIVFTEPEIRKMLANPLMKPRIDTLGAMMEMTSTWVSSDFFEAFDERTRAFMIRTLEAQGFTITLLNDNNGACFEK